MRVLITEPAYKHSMALSRYLKAFDPGIETIALSSYAPRFPKLIAAHYDRMIIGELENIIDHEPHELLIPVGNTSVAIASAINAKTAVLPSAASIHVGMNKSLTLSLAKELGVPIPETHVLKSLDELNLLSLPFPCVVKGTMEAGKNIVSYPTSIEEMKRDVSLALNDPTQRGQFPIIQEYVSGVGLGFFGFYQNGVLKRFYMHQRIREYPISGGASTAAKTIYHQQAFEYSKKLLDHLKWNGPAMVEFKYNPETGKLALMEINPKFWGSTELGLAAGVNFGELLVRVKRGEELKADYSPESYRRTTFCWPFEGDLAALAQSRNWRGFKEYWQKEYKTNVKANGFWLNCFRLIEFFRRKK